MPILVNQSIQNNIFPDRLKQAQVILLLKKEDPLLKTIYRHASILPTMSKGFEKVLSVQLSDYLDGIFNNALCAFRKGIGCKPHCCVSLKIEKKAFDQILHEWLLF